MVYFRKRIIYLGYLNVIFFFKMLALGGIVKDLPQILEGLLFARYTVLGLVFTPVGKTDAVSGCMEPTSCTMEVKWLI